MYQIQTNRPKRMFTYPCVSAVRRRQFRDSPFRLVECSRRESDDASLLSVGGNTSIKENTKSASIPGMSTPTISMSSSKFGEKQSTRSRGDSADGRSRARNGRRRPFPLPLPSPAAAAGRVPACVPTESRGPAETAERGRRSCRARMRRSPLQFEVGQRDVVTFHPSWVDRRIVRMRRAA